MIRLLWLPHSLWFVVESSLAGAAGWDSGEELRRFRALTNTSPYTIRCIIGGNKEGTIEIACYPSALLSNNSTLNIRAWVAPIPSWPSTNGPIVKPETTGISPPIVPIQLLLCLLDSYWPWMMWWVSLFFRSSVPCLREQQRLWSRKARRPMSSNKRWPRSFSTLRCVLTVLQQIPPWCMSFFHAFACRYRPTQIVDSFKGCLAIVILSWLLAIQSFSLDTKNTPNMRTRSACLYEM